ncbi:MAG: hypothetical protein K2I35_08085, partial [Duncaniella sp.]|nr:hypothetical protein [Duncaniella sp.]
MLNLDTQETHEGNTHQSRENESNAHTTERSRDIGVSGETLPLSLIPITEPTSLLRSAEAGVW